MRIRLWLLLGAMLAGSAHAEDRYEHQPRETIGAGEQAVNFGLVYVVQWASYLTTQGSIIKEHGSWENWREYPGKAHFDNDHFNFNLSKHTLVGQYYYLFYRSRGYTRKLAFEWTFLSSLAFEFTIETYTERPSYQDIYQTPVFGVVVGMGLERLSLYMHSLETVPTTMLGYLFDPFTILPNSYYRLGWQPLLRDGRPAVALVMGVDL